MEIKIKDNCFLSLERDEKNVSSGLHTPGLIIYFFFYKLNIRKQTTLISPLG